MFRTELPAASVRSVWVMRLVLAAQATLVFLSWWLQPVWLRGGVDAEGLPLHWFPNVVIVTNLALCLLWPYLFGFATLGTLVRADESNVLIPSTTWNAGSSAGRGGGGP